MKKIKLNYLFILFANVLISQPLTVNSTFTNNKIIVKNTVTNDTIISATPYNIWDPAVGAHQSTIIPTVQTLTYTNGFDIKYTFLNTSSDTSSLGIFNIGGFHFDSIIHARDFQTSGYEYDINHHNLNYYGGGANYPNGNYSPVAVFGDDSITVGISFIYPIMDYKHEIFMRVESPNPQNLYARLWQLNIVPNAYNIPNSVKYYREGELAPGETRTYTISVRLSYRNDKCNTWITNLEPYKNYFRNKYGTVQYKRAVDPIAGYLPGDLIFLSSNNPYAFSPGNNNPAIHGFGPISRSLIRTEDLGYKKVLLWAPTGFCKNNLNLNYCFKFTSHWLEGDTSLYPHSYGHNMHDAIDSLSLVSNNGRELGLWWGRSTEIMDNWDSAYSYVLNPNNASHVAKGLYELSLAKQAGTKIIGLDQFSGSTGTEIPIWHSFNWLKIMRSNAPAIKFACEQGTGDILNTQAAFVYYSDRMKSPHYLADYLLPGNEIWSLLVQNLIAPTCMDEIHRVTQNGQIAVNLKCADTLVAPYLAVESWWNTMPKTDLGPDTLISASSIYVLDARFKDFSSCLWSNGSTASSIQVSSPGVYYVTCQNTYGCLFSDTVVISFIPNNIKHFNLNNSLFSLYPNPAQTSLIINTSEPIKEIIFYDLTSKIILSINNPNTNNKINIDNLSNGLFIVKAIFYDNTIQTKKLIVNK